MSHTHTYINADEKVLMKGHKIYALLYSEIYGYFFALRK